MLRIARKRTIHKLTARHSFGFAVHSPFLFNFTKYVIYEKNPYYVFPKIESLFLSLKEDEKKNSSIKSSESDSKKHFLKQPKLRARQLLFRIVNELKPTCIVELGTTCGFTTMYLAQGNSNASCITIGESEEAARKLIDNTALLQIKNVKVRTGNIVDEFAKIVENTAAIDLIFVNSSVSDDSLLECFNRSLSVIHNNSIVIVSGIYETKERENVWKKITDHEKVTAHIDLFCLGILFFKKDLIKKNYRMLF